MEARTHAGARETQVSTEDGEGNWRMKVYIRGSGDHSIVFSPRVGKSLTRVMSELEEWRTI